MLNSTSLELITFLESDCKLCLNFNADIQQVLERYYTLPILQAMLHTMKIIFMASLKSNCKFIINAA